ncbi:MAG TPA: bifunctional glutamate N-acetyltransferase/amino-acid acetyltransferase ArgJ [Acidimicrobiales bacterium]|nr:bifunctional glutamate N-acetyltransferase/amino-acid acetyltransferase ArgJ [Acidimicrobiales bacterium]
MITSPKGFVANGVHCGIKEDPAALDLSLVATDDHQPVAAAGVFTSNKATAAPVNVSKSHLIATGGHASAVILNSGNANAATGAQGESDAKRMAALVASALGCDPTAVLVCSTGLIGIPLPIDPVEAGIAPLAQELSANSAGATRAADAILTTDTVRKVTLIEGNGFSVGGMAKGAAMLAPNMATMLAVLTTDAAVDPDMLQSALAEAVARSFNEMTIDGCTSTNDTVLVFASGRAGAPDPSDFRQALADTCADLSRQMVADAEGATKLATVSITGAASHEDARRAARKIAESQLVKCSLFGADPYWGRIVSEIGSAGIEFDINSLSVSYGNVTVCANGMAATHDESKLRTHLHGRDVEISADLGLGSGTATILTADLTPDYIDENMRTS